VIYSVAYLPPVGKALFLMIMGFWLGVVYFLPFFSLFNNGSLCLRAIVSWAGICVFVSGCWF